MSEGYLDRVNERADAATPGPWAMPTTSKGAKYGVVVGPAEYAEAPDEAGFYGGALIGESIRRHNSRFIAAARTDVPNLVAALVRWGGHARTCTLLVDPRSPWDGVGASQCDCGWAEFLAEGTLPEGTG